MEINVLIDEGLETHLEVSWLQSVAEQALAAQKVSPDAELSLVIASQERVRRLNRDYLGKDVPTDVIAFSMLPEPMAGGEPGVPPFVTPPDGVSHLGEVIVSYPQAVIQAEEHHHPVKKELIILIVHGVLHVLGYDHAEPDQERQMRAREAEIMSQVEGGQTAI